MTKRTEQQSKALWLFFTMLADALNDAGLDMKKVLKPDIAIPWNKDSVHDYLWIPIQSAVVKTSSTTELDKQEVSEIYDILTRHLSEKFGVHVDFPSHELNYWNHAPMHKI